MFPSLISPLSPESRLVVRTGLAVVADELEAADHLADGEEADALGEDDAAGGELGGAEVAGLGEEVLGRGEDGAVLDGLPEVLVVGLDVGDGAVRGVSDVRLEAVCAQEGGDVRRAHLLAAGDVLGHLEADLGVVDDEGCLLYRSR